MSTLANSQSCFIHLDKFSTHLVLDGNQELLKFLGGIVALWSC